ncbi:MAG: hypothetical protein HQM15_09330 [Deltaproteobacteria bacterium]|nr:hypothetical protein [Deltaproteobacteria bacterium]
MYSPLLKFAKKISPFFLIILLSCGSSTTSTNADLSSPAPILISFSPNPVSIASTLSIQGEGFSPLLNENFLSIGAFLISSSHYSVVSTAQGNLEQLDFVLPAGLSAGTYSAYLMVRENPSNSLGVVVE